MSNITPNITMELIKQLREKTQVGMMDCKKALLKADGDIEKAIEILRKQGAAVAAKRSEHETDHGIIKAYISSDSKIGSLAAIGCETDFSAKTEDLQKFAETVSEHIGKYQSECDSCDNQCLLKQKLFNNEKITVQEFLDELIAKIRENIKISQFIKFKVQNSGLINAYIHPGSTLGAIVKLKVANLTPDNLEEIKKLAKDICMQIAVTNPLAIDPSQVDPKLLEKEENIIKEQLAASGKPEAIINKIMIGKINKYYEEVCLIKQKYIKQDKITIDQHIKEIEKQTNSTISVEQFQRFNIGK